MTYITPKPHWIEATKAKASAAELRLWQALEEVEDPEIPVSVVDMGLIYGLQLQKQTVNVQLTFTSMGCPCMEFIIEDIRERLLKESAVGEVAMEIVWDPPWTRKRMTEKGMERMKSWGITV